MTLDTGQTLSYRFLQAIEKNRKRIFKCIKHACVLQEVVGKNIEKKLSFLNMIKSKHAALYLVH